MNYFRTTSGRMTLACFLAASSLLLAFPAIDLSISGIFFDSGLRARTAHWHPAIQTVVRYFLVLSMICVIAVYLYNRWSKRDVGAICGRKVCYLLAVLVLGAGLIVNLALKDHVGRARPRDIAEFGGTKRFTPPFVYSRECDQNCSFPSGDAAGAFFSLALARALSRRRVWLIAGIAFGFAVSLSRVAAGAHFFSDTVTSFFVMWILSHVLYRYMISMRRPGVVRDEGDRGPHLDRDLAMGE